MTTAEKVSVSDRVRQIIGDTRTDISDRLQALFDRDPAKEKVKMTIGDGYRLGRKMKPKHKMSALWDRVFGNKEVAKPEVGSVCHLGAIAVGFGDWDNGAAGEWWPTDAPNPMVTLPCECGPEFGKVQMTTAIVHLADIHGTSGRYSNQFVADWIDNVGPTGHYDTRWTVRDILPDAD